MTSSNQPHIEVEATLKTGLASTGQRLLWIVERSRGESGALNVPVIARLRSKLNQRAMENAVTALVARHETLRTRMQWKRPRLIRVVASGWRPEVRTINVSTASDPATAFEQQLKAELTTDIASTEWPLRPTIWTLAPDDHVVCLNLNHMATDSISNAIILNELAILYRAECGEAMPPLPEIGWQYSQWVDSQMSQLEGRARARLIEYWERHLEGAVGPLFSTASTSPNANRLTGYESSPLAPHAFAGMARLAKEQRATLFSVVLAIFYTAICRQTGQTDVTVMTLLSDRNRPQVFSTVGYFVNAVPLRTAFSLSNSFVELLRSCRSTLFGAIQHQTMSFHVLPRMVTRQANLRIDNVVVQMMGDPAEFPKPFEPWDRHPDFGGGRTIDLEVVVQPVLNSWCVNVLYATHRFDRQFILDLLADFCEVAELAVVNPLLTIRDLVS